MHHSPSRRHRPGGEFAVERARHVDQRAPPPGPSRPTLPRRIGPAAADAVRAFHETTDGPSALAVLEHDSHLGWLAPDAVHYDDANRLVQAFLDRHLRGADPDLTAIVDDTVFVEFDEHG